MRVVTLPMSDRIPPSGDDPGVPALPVIPGAAMVNKEGNSGWYHAYFKPTNERWISLQEYPNTPGKFIVWATDDSLLRALPDGAPFDEREWGLWVIEESADEEAVGRMVELSTVPSRDASTDEPWTMDGKSVTRSAPVMRSRCGHVRTHDLRELLAETKFEA